MECNFLIPAEVGIHEVLAYLVELLVIRAYILFLVIVLGGTHLRKVHILFIHHLLLGVTEVWHFCSLVLSRL